MDEDFGLDLIAAKNGLIGCSMAATGLGEGKFSEILFFEVGEFGMDDGKMVEGKYISDALSVEVTEFGMVDDEVVYCKFTADVVSFGITVPGMTGGEMAVDKFTAGVMSIAEEDA